QRDDVVRHAVDAGIPRERFDGWDGARIALYRSLGNTSWVDLGLFAFQVTRTRWELLKKKLDDAGLGYESKDPVVEGALEQRARSEERHGVLVLQAPAVVDVEAFDCREARSESGKWMGFVHKRRSPVPAPAGGTGKGHELGYNFAGDKLPQIS